MIRRSNLASLRLSGVQRSLLLLFAILALMVTLVLFSPQLYNLFCRVTGFGGTLRVDEGGTIEATEATEGGQAFDKEFTVLFQAGVSGGLPWQFTADQRRMRVTVNELYPATYTAQNRIRAASAGEAIYSVSPAEVAPYFVKIACFCFIRQELAPLEAMTMPLQFYIDPAILDDPIAREVKRITLFYEFLPRS